MVANFIALHSQEIKDNPKMQNKKIHRAWFTVSPIKGCHGENSEEVVEKLFFYRKNRQKRNNNDCCCILTFPASAKSLQNKADGKEKRFKILHEKGELNTFKDPNPKKLKFGALDTTVMYV